MGFSVVCAAAASANPAILLFPSIGTTTQVTVRGRVLREAPTRGSSTMSKNMRLLAGDTWEVVLVGDSGERDPEVYAQIQAEFPDRVLATYIHDVGRSQDPKRFRNMMLFKSAFEAGADSVGRGLAAPECLKAWLHP